MQVRDIFTKCYTIAFFTILDQNGEHQLVRRCGWQANCNSWLNMDVNSQFWGKKISVLVFVLVHHCYYFCFFCVDGPLSLPKNPPQTLAGDQALSLVSWHSYVPSFDNYLDGIPNATTAKLQRLRSCLARVIALQQRKSCHAHPLLKSLHWLPVSQRIDWQCWHARYFPRLSQLTSINSSPDSSPARQYHCALRHVLYTRFHELELHNGIRGYTDYQE